MPKARQKKRRDKRRVIETALPKRQYKRTNRLLYVFSGILLVVFGGGAALVGAGAPRGNVTPTQPPIVSTLPPGAESTAAPTAATPAASPQAGVATSTGTLTTPTPTSAPASPTSTP